MSLSAVVLMKHEQSALVRCLESVKFCKEILVVCDDSSDQSVEIARSAGARVVNRILGLDFAAQRNFGLDQAKYDHVLFVDADEEVSPELIKEIQDTVKESNNIVYRLRRRDFFLGREMKHGETGEARNHGIIRLVKKGTGTWVGAVHEEFATHVPQITLKHFINHYPHQSVAEFIRDINTYSSLRADELYSRHIKLPFFQILVYPFFKFMYTYFLRLGFLDGPEGFIYSFLMSFHSFLVRIKLYQKYHFASPA